MNVPRTTTPAPRLDLTYEELKLDKKEEELLFLMESLDLTYEELKLHCRSGMGVNQLTFGSYL